MLVSNSCTAVITFSFSSAWKQIKEKSEQQQAGRLAYYSNGLKNCVFKAVFCQLYVSDDSEVAFDSEAWEEIYNYNIQVLRSVLRELERDLEGQGEGNAYVGEVWERICGNMMTALSYGVN